MNEWVKSTGTMARFTYLVCMWSNNEDHRALGGYTISVSGSDFSEEQVGQDVEKPKSYIVG
jgi:hypothetical protein